MNVARILPAALLAAAALSGCSREITRVPTPDQPPEVLLSVVSDFFSATFAPGKALGQDRWITIEIPADQKVTLNLSAVTPAGVRVKFYRWRLETPAGEQAGLVEEPDNASLTIGPFQNAGDVIFLHLEIVTTSVTYYQIIRFVVVRPSFDSPLLIVDDARLPPDNFVNGVFVAPRGPWPSAAELDTFLFAVGGMPWRHYPPGPGGQARLTTSGIFNGYDFDTLGTRGLPFQGIVPMSILGRYRHVIWYTDQNGATFRSSPLDPRSPVTALRQMNSPGQFNALAQYVAQGGRLWLLGGGAAYATLIEWNRQGTSTDVYTAEDGEVVPGRFIYDWARWRSSITTPWSSNRAELHLAGVLTPFNDPSTAPGRGWPGQPNYSGLPASLNPRSPASDPIPPLRSAATFYKSDFPVELLTAPNVIVEGGSSTLDSLYLANADGVLRPVMTLHHGADGNPALFSGFAIWDFRRTQAIAVVDFVLQHLWGMQRDIPRRVASTRAPAPRAQRRQ